MKASIRPSWHRYRAAMADLASIASLATAGGTLVLAFATFASVRSANRAARVAETSLLIGLRPVLAPTRFDDPEQKINWGDEHWTHLPGGHAGVERADTVIYLSLPLRNIGNGIAVLDGWHVGPWRTERTHVPLDGFRAQQRSLYVASSDIGFWQGALRDPSEPDFESLAAIIERRERFAIELLYSDHQGGQQAITRFGCNPSGDGDTWLATVARHWRVDSE
jgi:hypothetical protein